MPIGSVGDDSDDLLLPAIGRGDEAAFRSLYRRHTPRLRMLVLRMLGGHEADADDVVQESWVRAIAGLRQFRGASTFGTWLGGIGIRASWEVIRRRRGIGELPDGDSSPVDPPDTAARVDLDDALRGLPDVPRAVVVLHDVEGFSHEEIAEALGIATGTSRSHLSRARQMLRDRLRSHERISK